MTTIYTSSTGNTLMGNFLASQKQHLVSFQIRHITRMDCLEMVVMIWHLIKYHFPSKSPLFWLKHPKQSSLLPTSKRNQVIKETEKFWISPHQEKIPFILNPLSQYYSLLTGANQYPTSTYASKNVKLNIDI